MTPQNAKILIIIGLGLVLLGLVFYFGGDWFKWIGKLPGDIALTGKNGRFYFPIVTCIVLSVVLNVVIWAIKRFF